MTPVDDGTERLRARLEPVRAWWLEHFAAAVADARENGDLHVEPAMRDGDGNVVKEGWLETGLRPDFVQSVDGSPEGLYVDAPIVEGQVPFAFELNSAVRCEVHPLKWQELRLRIMPAEPLDLSPLTAWFWEWFDANDLNDADERGFYGVVHWMSEPTFGDTGVVVDVDLGSAPVDAWLGLLDAVAATGARKLVVWSPGTGVAEPIAYGFDDDEGGGDTTAEAAEEQA